jgi:hypothetical protein
MSDADLAAYVAERDAAFNAGFAEFIVFAAMHGQTFSDTEVAEIAFHKCRTASMGVRSELRSELRSESDLWLTERGYKSWKGSANAADAKGRKA